jgi:hypothetical protein
LRLYKLSWNCSGFDFQGRNGPSVPSFYDCLVPSFTVIRNLVGRRFFDGNKWSANYNMFSLFILFKDCNFVMGPFFFELIAIASFVIANSVFSTKVEGEYPRTKCLLGGCIKVPLSL